MPQSTHHYSKDGLTIIWKPALCTHSTNCWRGLISVFHPRELPWITPEGASAEEIVEQVKKCPSGALSFEWDKDKELSIGKMS